MSGLGCMRFYFHPNSQRYPIKGRCTHPIRHSALSMVKIIVPSGYKSVPREPPSSASGMIATDSPPTPRAGRPTPMDEMLPLDLTLPVAVLSKPGQQCVRTFQTPACLSEHLSLHLHLRCGLCCTTRGVHLTCGVLCAHSMPRQNRIGKRPHLFALLMGLDMLSSA